MANTKEKMQEKTCEAIFEKGVFRPLSSLEIVIPEGQRVKLIVEPIEFPDNILKQATSVYDGLSEEQINEIEQIILSRENFFKGRNYK